MKQTLELARTFLLPIGSSVIRCLFFADWEGSSAVTKTRCVPDLTENCLVESLQGRM